MYIYITDQRSIFELLFKDIQIFVNRSFNRSKSNKSYIFDLTYPFKTPLLINS